MQPCKWISAWERRRRSYRETGDWRTVQRMDAIAKLYRAAIPAFHSSPRWNDAALLTSAISLTSPHP